MASNRMEMKTGATKRVPLTDITYEPWVWQRSGTTQQRTGALDLTNETKEVVEMEHRFQGISLNTQTGFQTPVAMSQELKDELLPVCYVPISFVITSANKSYLINIKQGLELIKVCGYFF